MLPWCKREGSQAVAGGAGEMSLRWKLKPRPDCLVLTSETLRVQYKAKDSQTRRLQSDGGVDAASAVRPATMAGRGDRAAPRVQARAQAQAVAAGTSSRLSLLMPRLRAAGRDGEAHLLLRLCNLYILCESVRRFSVMRGRTFERG
jgi:hypothetical protein